MNEFDFLKSLPSPDEVKAALLEARRRVKILEQSLPLAEAAAADPDTFAKAPVTRKPRGPNKKKATTEAAAV